MISQTMQTAINDQIKAEIESAYIYLAMSAYCEAKTYPGMAHWLRLQWKEELEHAMKLYEYVYDRGGRVTLDAIPKPSADFGTPLKVFEAVLEHEQKVTTRINSLFALAVKEGDYASQVELQWFIKEQVEEEKHATEIIDQLKMVGESGPSMIMLDRHLGSRS
jgi:ferritin